MTNRTPYLAATAAAFALAGCGGSHPPSADPEPPPAVVAAVSRAERLEIPSTVVVHGTVEAVRVAAVSARVMATVTATHAATGDRVRRGDLLLTIDPTTTEGHLLEARGALAQAEASLALADKNLRRFEALAERDAASPLEVDLARAQTGQARGAVQQARGAVKAAASVASESRVTAPFAGRILRRLVEIGDLAAPGRPLFLVESEEGRHLKVDVSEAVMARTRLETGDAVAVRLDARPELGELAGTVSEVAPGADPGSHSFAVKVSLPIAALPTGSAGRSWIEIGRRPAVAVPATAIVRFGGLELVALRDDGGRTSTRAVTTGGRLADGRIEVLSGLRGGEEVLLGLAELPPAGSPIEEER